jgi:hypothetical protein
MRVDALPCKDAAASAGKDLAAGPRSRTCPVETDAVLAISFWVLCFGAALSTMTAPLDASSPEQLPPSRFQERSTLARIQQFDPAHSA